MDFVKLRELQASGCSQREIAAELGVNQSKVNRALKALDESANESPVQVAPWSDPPPPNPILEPGADLILARYQAGEDLRKIARDLGLDHDREHPERRVRQILYRQKWEVGLIGPASVPLPPRPPKPVAA